jgi:urea carboxylase
MPILLGPDGPSLGGFVCPAVVAQAELWKMGQLRAGDTVRFRLITNAQATAWNASSTRPSHAEQCVAASGGRDAGPAVLRTSGTTVYAAAGDRYLLVETGPNELTWICGFASTRSSSSCAHSGLRASWT